MMATEGDAMKRDDESDHPDEGTIHAWLDGALAADDSARLDAHVAECPACAERVAEARGLVAGASRVVGLLDDVAAPLIKPAVTPTANTDLSVWRMLRVTPARASIAAMLVVAVGIALTRGQLGVENPRTEMATRPPVVQAPAASEMSGVGAGGAAAAPRVSSVPPMADSVLSSGIARRLAKEQPLRSMEAAPGSAIPTAPAEAATGRSADFANAHAKVLAGRASVAAQRETSGTRADRTRAGMGQVAAGSVVALDRVTVASAAAASLGEVVVTGIPHRDSRGVAAGECYRVESTVPANWGSVRLPLIIAMDSAGTDARVLTLAGGETEARAYLQYNGADSAIFRLRRIGYSGSLMLAATGAMRSGVIRSSASSAAASAPMAARQSANKAAGDRNDAPAIPVTARRVSCPSPG